MADTSVLLDDLIRGRGGVESLVSRFLELAPDRTAGFVRETLQTLASLLCDIDRERLRVAKLLEVANSLTSRLDLGVLMQDIMARTSEMLDADRSSLFLIDRATGALYSRIAQGLGVEEIRIPRGVGIAGHVAATLEPLNLADAYDHPLFNRETDLHTGYRTRSLLCVPIVNVHSAVIGVTQVMNKKSRSMFDGTDEALLRAISAQAAIALENAQLYESTASLKRYLESILQSLENGVVAVGADDAVTLANPAAGRILDRDPAALVGRRLDEVLRENPVPAGPGSGLYTAYDVVLTTAAGRSVTANITAQPLLEADGRRTGTVIVVEDVTREKRISSSLTQYMARDMAERVIEEAGRAGLDGAEQEASVLFCDIHRFSDLSAALRPREVVSLLSEFFGLMVDEVFRHQGMLDRLQGDGLMAIFGAPLALANHAPHACRAAVGMHELLGEHNGRRRERKGEPIEVGIGIASGAVLYGHIGNQARMQHATLGPAVGAAARLEGANGMFGTRTIMTEATVRQLSDEFAVRELDRIRVRGLPVPTTIYELIGPAGSRVAAERAPLVACHTEGLTRYRERRFEEAGRLFRRALALDPADVPSRLHLERCEYLQANPPAPGWDGLWNV